MRTAESIGSDTPLDIDLLRAVLRDHPVRLAILFGSHATGTIHATSDIDLAVEFDGHQPTDPEYNDVFLGLSVDLSETLETDGIDLVDLRTTSPQLTEAIFENGVLMIGDNEHAIELRQQITASRSDQRSPRERLETALDRIDDHLDGGDSGVLATGDEENDG